MNRECTEEKMNTVDGGVSGPDSACLAFLLWRCGCTPNSEGWGMRNSESKEKGGGGIVFPLFPEDSGRRSGGEAVLSLLWSERTETAGERSRSVWMRRPRTVICDGLVRA